MLLARPSRFNLTVCSGWDILILLALMLFDAGFTINFYYFLPSDSLMHDLFMTFTSPTPSRGARLCREQASPIVPGLLSGRPMSSPWNNPTRREELI